MVERPRENYEDAEKILLEHQSVYKPLISVPGRRFPRARLQSPRHCVPAGLSARAVPAGVAAFHSNSVTVKKEPSDPTSL